jgi:hypothetical protein
VRKFYVQRGTRVKAGRRRRHGQQRLLRRRAGCL